MAHAVKLGALTDELVTLLTLISAKNEPSRFSTHKELALRALRYSNYPRTNQFDVANNLDGLEEKFRVYNEDPLADALRERRNKLEELEVKWTPEILHLLLELSDKPLSNSKLEDLDFLKEPEPDTGPPLRWKDLVAEDPLLRDKHVWRNVDFAADSSDEDGFEDSLSEHSEFTASTTQSSVQEEANRRPEDYIVDVPSKERLIQLRDAQFWLKTPSVNGVVLETVKKLLTELQAVREILFMLAGLPTSLFQQSTEDSKVVEPSKGFALKHASPGAFLQVIKDIADTGSALIVLRSWTNIRQPIPLLQIFQGAIQNRLTTFDEFLSMIQERFVQPKENTVVSLLSISAEINCHARPLVKLSTIIQKLVQEPYAHAFRYLEMLFDEACVSQMGGDAELYNFIGTIFFECFQVYLRPIRIWMEEGELIKGDNVFFISETSGAIEPAAIWQSRFKLRQTQDGVLHAPKFLRTAANKIFTTGKSIVVLKQLNQFSSMQKFGSSIEPRLNFDTVCNLATLQLAPFAELFEMGFDSWIQSKHSHASTTLRRILFGSCGLQTSLEALSDIYFMANGAIAAWFTNHLFDKLDTLDPSWCDSFTVTELSKGAFGALSSVNPDRLRTVILPLRSKNKDLNRLRRTVKVLEIVSLKYNLPWPIQIILPATSLASYQRIFTFLFQIRRSIHILSRQRLITDVLNTTASSSERALFYALRTRLIWFLQTIYYYLTSLVLEPGTNKMREALKAAADVDSMIEVHALYIKSAVEKCLLGAKLELIHKTILKILDIAIKLEDTQAANAVASKEAMDRQQEMMDLSMASLGLHTPQKSRSRPRPNFRRSIAAAINDNSSSDEEKEVDIDLSILSSNLDEGEQEELYVDKLRKMKADFDRLVRFVGSGLKGVARAGGGDEARAWDTLGEMIESGFGGSVMGIGGVGRSW